MLDTLYKTDNATLLKYRNGRLESSFRYVCHVSTYYDSVPCDEVRGAKFEPLIFILHSIGGGGGITLIDE